MKKTIGIIISCLFLFGCSCMDMGAKKAVTDFLDNYNNLSSEVLDDLEIISSKEDLTDEQKDTYKNIIKKQYQDLKYEIVEEEYNGDNAVITAKIIVYDLYKAQKDANLYMQENIEEFYDKNNIYSNKKYIDYKLDVMKKMMETVTYTIDFEVNKENDKWVIKQPSEIDLEKIHGIYNYEQ